MPGSQGSTSIQVKSFLRGLRGQTPFLFAFVCLCVTNFGFCFLRATDGVTPSSRGEQREVIGYGYAMDKEHLLYTEERIETRVDGEVRSWVVKYRNPEGKVLVEKTLDFSSGLISPTLGFLDFRFDYEEGVGFEGDKLKLYKGDKNDPQSRHIVVPKTLVVDAGIDFLVQDRWESLLTGNQIPFSFAVPSEKKCFRLAITKTGQTRLAGRDAVVFVMKPSGIILRFLADPIELVYDPATKKMMRFSGLASVHPGRRGGLPARIVFPEPGENPLDYLHDR